MNDAREGLRPPPPWPTPWPAVSTIGRSPTGAHSPSPERLLVLQYERCAQDPAGQLARTFDFLGIDDTFVPPDLRREVGVTTNDKVDLADDARRRLIEAYPPDVEALAGQFPDLDLGLWPNFVPRPVS